MISNVKVVFFDLDDTLMNFKQAEEYSLYDLSKEFISEGDFAKHLVEYRRISHKLWDEFELGSGSKESIRKDRFKIFFEYLGVDADPEKASDDFFSGLARHNHYMPNALEVLEKISDKYPIYIITNGFEKVQLARLENSPIKNIVKAMVVSESCGYQKPEIAIFNHALKIAGSPNSNDVLIIGDKIQTDIKGGIRAGWQTCWYNPRSLKNYKNDLTPTLEIKDLNELIKALELK